MKPQPSTMDEPGGPEAPLSDARSDEEIARRKGSSEDTDAVRSDPDFRPPVTPGEPNKS